MVMNVYACVRTCARARLCSSVITCFHFHTLSVNLDIEIQKYNESDTSQCANIPITNNEDTLVYCERWWWHIISITVIYTEVLNKSTILLPCEIRFLVHIITFFALFCMQIICVSSIYINSWFPMKVSERWIWKRRKSCLHFIKWKPHSIATWFYF